MSLDRGYDSDKTRSAPGELGFTGEIARKGIPAPIQAGKRWVVERSHAWMNVSLSAAIVRLRMLIRHATPRYRWNGHPTTRRLKYPFAGRSQPQPCSCWSRSASPSIRSEPAGMRMYMSRAISLAVP